MKPYKKIAVIKYPNILKNCKLWTKVTEMLNISLQASPTVEIGICRAEHSLRYILCYIFLFHYANWAAKATTVYYTMIATTVNTQYATTRTDNVNRVSHT